MQILYNPENRKRQKSAGTAATFTRSATPYRLTPMFSGLSAAVDGYKIYILYGRRYFNLLINVGI